MPQSAKKFSFDSGKTDREFHARPQPKTVEQRAREFRDRKRFNFLHPKVQAQK